MKASISALPTAVTSLELDECISRSIGCDMRRGAYRASRRSCFRQRRRPSAAAATEAELAGSGRGPAAACRHTAAHASGTLEPSCSHAKTDPSDSAHSAASSAAEPAPPAPPTPSPHPAGRISMSARRPAGGRKTDSASARSKVAKSSATWVQTSGREWYDPARHTACITSRTCCHSSGEGPSRSTAREASSAASSASAAGSSPLPPRGASRSVSSPAVRLLGWRGPEAAA
mmetsp:Transcript_862/g.2682  ORF Transcript_862/g.2682 Transcript_862/m.2682 type:complete len:231 (+) Transcript_862:4108-4800(+)